MTEGQYTLDADPMVLANRVKTLEHAFDLMSACLVETATSCRLLADCLDQLACEDRPQQAQMARSLHEDFGEIYQRAHTMSTLMNRSY